MKHKKILYFLAFLLPIVLTLAIFFLLHITPFGDETILFTDMNGQYINFFSYFKSIFTSLNDLFYTFSKCLGGDMFALVAYYLMSPFNLILLFIPTSLLPFGMTLLYVLKVGTAGLTSFIYLKSHKEIGFATLLFSVAYAFIGFTVCYFFDVMWLDSVIILPIMVLGLDFIFEEKNTFMYPLSLGYALIVNYYIGFMLCIFSVIYFVYKLIITEGFLQKGKHWTFIFIKRSLLAGALSAFIWIPSFLSLKGGRASLALDTMSLNPNLHVLDLFSKLYTGSFNWNQVMEGFPNIYITIPLLALAILYFFNKEISYRKKIGALFLLLIFGSSFYFNAFNLIWHGLNYPAWFPYRYSFLFSFVLIMLAYQEFITDKKISFKSICSIILGFLVLSFIMFRRKYEFLHTYQILFDVFLFIICIFLYHFLKMKKSIYLTVILLLLTICDASIHLYLSINRLFPARSGLTDYSTLSEYQKFYTSLNPVIQKLKEDSSFYRTEKMFRRTFNDAMLLNYNGLSHYSSTEKVFVRNFLYSLGFSKEWIYAYYGSGSTVAADSLLSVKYIIAKEPILKNYSKKFSMNNISVYENPYALPFVFSASNKVKNVHMNQSNLFILQNELYKSMAFKEKDSIFKKVPILDTQYDNIDIQGKVYSKKDPKKEASITVTLNTHNIKNFYVFMNSKEENRVDVYTDDIWCSHLLAPYSPRFLNLPITKDTIKVKFTLQNDEVTLNEMGFYYEDEEVLKRYVDEVKIPHTTHFVKSSHIKGDIDIENAGMLIFSLAYDEGFSLYLDGKKVKTEKAFGTLLAASIPSGKHTYEIKYIPKGLKTGSLITGLSLIYLSLIYFFRRMKKAV